METNRKASEKPDPAHPALRSVSLPWGAPKPPHEVPSAPALIEAILNSDEYRLADEDIDYLKSSDTRGMRLQLDDLKAQTLLEQHRIRGSVWKACPASTL